MRGDEFAEFLAKFEINCELTYVTKFSTVNSRISVTCAYTRCGHEMELTPLNVRSSDLSYVGEIE
jgi:hypothetical protein